MEINVVAVAALAIAVAVGFLFNEILRHTVGVSIDMLIDHFREPNIQFGELIAFPNDRRPSHKTWFYLECENIQRTGFIERRMRTQEAKDCHATVEFRPSSGEEAEPLIDDAVFVRGARNERRTTMFVGKRVLVPVYWIADGKCPHPVDGTGSPYPAGWYMTGDEFIHFDETRRGWKLDPGRPYRPIITVTWEGKSFVYDREELISPEQ
jgi:hypothetical protein